MSKKTKIRRNQRTHHSNKTYDQASKHKHIRVAEKIDADKQPFLDSLPEKRKPRMYGTALARVSRPAQASLQQLSFVSRCWFLLCGFSTIRSFILLPLPMLILSWVLTVRFVALMLNHTFVTAFRHWS